MENLFYKYIDLIIGGDIKLRKIFLEIGNKNVIASIKHYYIFDLYLKNYPCILDEQYNNKIYSIKDFKMLDLCNYYQTNQFILNNFFNNIITLTHLQTLSLHCKLLHENNKNINNLQLPQSLIYLKIYNNFVNVDNFNLQLPVNLKKLYVENQSLNFLYENLKNVEIVKSQIKYLSLKNNFGSLKNFLTVCNTIKLLQYISCIDNKDLSNLLQFLYNHVNSLRIIIVKFKHILNFVQNNAIHNFEDYKMLFNNDKPFRCLKKLKFEQNSKIYNELFVNGRIENRTLENIIGCNLMLNIFLNKMFTYLQSNNMLRIINLKNLNVNALNVLLKNIFFPNVTKFKNITNLVISDVINIFNNNHSFNDNNNNFFLKNLLELCKLLKYLKHLDIKNNNFNCEFPLELLLEMQHLTHLNASQNKFVGNLDIAFFNLNLIKNCNIKVLNLSYNNFTGKFPKFLYTLKFLEYLNLSYNQFEGFLDFNTNFNFNTNFLTGHNNCSGNFKQLRSIMLKNNKFCGTLPIEIELLENLIFVDFSKNNFDLQPKKIPHYYNNNHCFL